MTGQDLLTLSVAALLRDAAASATSAGTAQLLTDMQDRLHGPLRVAIAGKVKAGKSTLLNALLGEELAATDAGECTRIVTWYRRSPQPEVMLYPRAPHPATGADGGAERRPFSRDTGPLDVALGGWEPEQIDHLEVGWPTERLQDLTVIDTPGIASISEDVSARTARALGTDDGRLPVADAVLYLLRHTHASDIRFLESFHDDEVARATPMNAVGVLARADEIGSCRMDAMEVAARVSDRYQGEPRLHRLCPVIVPVAGLLAYAGATLTEHEYRALMSLASLEPSELAELLLTADRFLQRPVAMPATELERAHLLDRLGLFGVRFAVQLLRAGHVRSATELATELVRSSGLERLRGVLRGQFAERSRVLKARSALAAVELALADGTCREADMLGARLEEIRAGAHEFEEMRTLNDLRSGTLPMSGPRAEELERLLGGWGHDPASRLQLPPAAAASDVEAAAADGLARWQRVAEHPLTSRPVQRAGRVAIRTLEGIVADARDGATGSPGSR